MIYLLKSFLISLIFCILLSLLIIMMILLLGQVLCMVLLYHLGWIIYIIIWIQFIQELRLIWINIEWIRLKRLILILNLILIWVRTLKINRRDRNIDFIVCDQRSKWMITRVFTIVVYIRIQVIFVNKIRIGRLIIIIIRTLKMKNIIFIIRRIGNLEPI